VFGKKFSEYVQFDLWILILVALAFAVRLGLSLSGDSYTQIRWVSMNLVLLLGLVYCSIAVHTRGFGSYKQLYGLLVVQNAFSHLLIASAITLGIVTGTANVFTAPEVSGGNNGATWFHAILHVIAGILIVPLVAWLFGSLILLVTRTVKPAV
jgi:hypothetical protein